MNSVTRNEITKENINAIKDLIKNFIKVIKEFFINYISPIIHKLYNEKYIKNLLNNRKKEIEKILQKSSNRKYLKVELINLNNLLKSY